MNNSGGASSETAATTTNGLRSRTSTAAPISATTQNAATRSGWPEAPGQAKVGDREGNRCNPDEQRGHARAKRPPTPQPQRDERASRDRDRAVRMHRGQQPRAAGGQRRGAGCPQLQRAHEQVGGHCPGEDEERVHASEGAVDREDRGRREDESGDRP